MQENLLEVIQEISKEKGLNRDTLVQLVEETITQAAKKKLPYDIVEGHINPKTGQIELFHYRRVVEFPEDLHNEISLEEAQLMDSAAELDDEVEYEIAEKEFNRIAQSARQLIFKRIKDAEREMVFQTFQERKGDVLTGTVLRTESNGRVAINFLNKTEAYLFMREQIQGESFSYGEHVRVLLMDITNDPQKPSQLAISRTHPGLLMKLFELEVPEIYDGIVGVVNAAREPGKRAKISVYSSDPDVDPVGACVGVRGSRVQAVANELRGEKIDVVRWSDDLATYVQNALAPSEIESMEINEEERSVNVWVEPDQLSLAIGRQGQNVRLASKLIGYKINVSALEQKQGLSIEEQLAIELDKQERENQDNASAVEEKDIETELTSTHENTEEPEKEELRESTE